MSLRTFQNQMKEPIYKDDVLRVVLNGLIYSLLFSIVLGALQFFTETAIHLSFGIFVLILAYVIGKKVKDSFSSYHILYPILSVVFFILGYFIYRISKMCFMLHDVVAAFKLCFTGSGFMNFVLDFLNPYTYSGINIFNNVIEIIIVITSGILCYRIPMSKNF